MDLLNLRISRDSTEIFNTINSMYLNESPLMLWQNHSENRIIVNAYIEKIEFDRNRLIIKSKVETGFKGFRFDHPVYIRGESKSILFKQQQCRFNEQRIAITIPKEVRVQEQRLSQRVDTSNSSAIDVFFTKRVGSGAGSQKSFSAQLINLSSNGACFEFLQSLGKFFYEGDDIIISHFDHLSFDPPLEARIIYLQKRSYSSDRMRMGIKFRTHLTQEVMVQVIENHCHAQKIRLKQ